MAETLASSRAHAIEPVSRYKQGPVCRADDAKKGKPYSPCGRKMRIEDGETVCPKHGTMH